MEQQIGFCTTSDGAGIAYATLGEGPPLVYVTGWPGHLAIEWERPFAREFLESFAGEFTLVRYDMRNTGLSERAGEDMSLEALVRDLEAVVDKLRLDRFALMSLGLLAGPVAITFAAAHSERVSHMVALGPFLRGDRLLSEEQYKALRDYVAAFGQLVTPGDFRDPERHGLDQELVRQAAAIHDAGAPPQIQVRLLETLYRSDLTAALDRLDMPVLVLHGSGDGRVTLHASREVAARLPNVQFVPYEGVGAAPWADRDIILPEIFQFLGAAPPQIATKAPRPAGGMATILFTDMESSTALTQRLGDAKAQEIVRAHDAIVREALQAHGGSEIKHTGDGIMASFPSASGALECAVAIQRAVAAHEVGAHGRAPLQVRIGVNAGEPLSERDDLFGTSVQLARRICDHSQPGQILASNVVRELAAGKGFLFADIGEVVPKGFEEPVRLFDVRWQA